MDQSGASDKAAPPRIRPSADARTSPRRCRRRAGEESAGMPGTSISDRPRKARRRRAVTGWSVRVAHRDFQCGCRARQRDRRAGDVEPIRNGERQVENVTLGRRRIRAAHGIVAASITHPRASAPETAEPVAPGHHTRNHEPSRRVHLTERTRNHAGRRGWSRASASRFTVRNTRTPGKQRRMTVEENPAADFHRRIRRHGHGLRGRAGHRHRLHAHTLRAFSATSAARSGGTRPAARLRTRTRPSGPTFRTRVIGTCCSGGSRMTRATGGSRCLRQRRDPAFETRGGSAAQPNLEAGLQAVSSDRSRWQRLETTSRSESTSGPFRQADESRRGGPVSASRHPVGITASRNSAVPA